MTAVELAGGLALLVLGAEILVRGAVVLAAAARVPPVVVGLTVVAWATSAPELGASLSAALDDRGDLALGNVIGSNIFNLLFVAGLAGIVGGGLPAVHAAQTVDLPLMLATAVLCLPFLRSAQQLSRREAGIFLSGYAAYLAYLLARG